MSGLGPRRLIFTWGEALGERVSRRFVSNKNVILVELLIATEYWLSLFRRVSSFDSGGGGGGGSPAQPYSVLSTADVVLFML